ncbi:hypothetical protein NEOLEDRAFT_1125879 [Neolentinus lepideus HHB14362 ss-1]|uniref:Uncharacterized protein n=1 Tax=Neolentinus lepideus HHB14362 ss-1 TaxID=1314782 RepID=A0A165VXW5_9AGAM|nr:hypothetical protein NEOLEDRAFT_1125879 [Neolentinus lepideus HHB14362 ss-1]
MDRFADDAELSQQMARLLGEELLRVKKELDDTNHRLSSHRCSTDLEENQSQLQDEVQSIRDENVQLRGRIHEWGLAASGNDLGDRRKPDPSAPDTLRDEIDRLNNVISQKEVTERQHIEKISALEGEVAGLLDMCTKYEALQPKSKPVEDAEAEALGKEPLSSASVDDFLHDFLAQLQSSSILLPKKPLEYVSNDENFKLTEKQVQMCTSDGYLLLKSLQVEWATATRTHGLAFAPFHQFNADVGICKWRRSGLSQYHQHRKYELLHAEGHQWFYLGTYEIADLRSLSFHQVKARDNHIKEYLIESTILLPKNLIPPFVTAMMTNMYEAGMLKVECVALRRTGFNQRLYNSLRSVRQTSENGIKHSKAVPEKGQSTNQGSKRKFDEAEGSQDAQTSDESKKAKLETFRSFF